MRMFTGRQKESEAFNSYSAVRQIYKNYKK